MHIQHHDHTANRESPAPAPGGMGGRAALWVAAAIGLTLLLGATGVRVLVPAGVPVVTPSD